MDPHKGSIELNGKTFSEDKESYRSQFTYIPETPVLYEELTLKEHLELTAMAYGLSKKHLKKASSASERIQNGKKAEMVSRSLFQRDEAESHDHVRVSRGAFALYH